MTAEQQKEILNLSDTIEGEINRMCVTNSLVELNNMTLHARNNIIRLNSLIYEIKFKKENKND